MADYTMDDTLKITIGAGGSAISFVPQSYSLTISGVDYDTGRVASGNMERNMVNEKRSCQITLPPMHTSVIAPIIRAVSGTEHAAFTATIIDPSQPTCTYTGTFYVGDRSLPVYNCALDLWDAASFDLIEY